MKNFSYLIGTIIILFVASKWVYDNIVFKKVKSRTDSNYYFVLNTKNSQEASDYLGKLNNDILKLLDYLESNENYIRYGIHKEHIQAFRKRYNHTILSEANLSDKPFLLAKPNG